MAAADSAVFYAESLANEPGVTLHRYDFKKREAAPWQKGVLAYSLSTNGKKLLFQTGDGWTVAGTEATRRDQGEEAEYRRAHAARSPAEWHQIFREAWRYERDFFYVKNLHGANWDSVYKMYEPWVASVGHRSDLTHLLDILGGELSVGHSFTGGGDTPEVPRVSVGLLGADLVPDNGRYRIAHIYTGENWNPDLRAPLSEPGVKVSEGDYILEVNGVELKAPTEPYSLFEGTAGRQTVLRVNSKPVMEGSRTRHRGAGRERNRLALPRVGGDGTVAWWIPSRAASWPTSGSPIPPTTASSTSTGTTSPSRDRLGAVVDERFNEGGYIADYVVDLLARKTTRLYEQPGGRPPPLPDAGRRDSGTQGDAGQRNVRVRRRYAALHVSPDEDSDRWSG